MPCLPVVWNALSVSNSLRPIYLFWIMAVRIQYRKITPSDFLPYFFKSENNIGFAAGNNLLLQKTKGYDWIALVNPDAFLEPEWLSKMLKAARIHPEYSFFASRLVQDENQENSMAMAIRCI